MSSKYYGTKGNTVLQMQKQLNALGAGLKEDGIWGKRTEAAYNRLSGQLPTAQDAQNGSNGAQTGIANEFDEDLKFEKDKARRLADAVQTSISRLDPDYKARLDALEKVYVGKKQDVQNSLLSKGMARSSYNSNMQDEEYKKWYSEQTGTIEEKKRKLDDLNTEISNIQADLAESEAIINRKKLEADQKLAEEAKEAAAKNSAGKKKGGTTSSKKADAKKWEITVMQNWYKMNTSAKETYFEKNWQNIYKQSSAVAKQMAKDLEKATGKQYIFSN